MHRNKKLFVIVSTLALAAVASCAGTREYVLQGTNVATGADGQLRVEELDGGNYQVNISVSNLLPPARVNEELTTYVVWIQPSEQTPQRVGTLNYDADERTGEMMATTAITAFQVVVSAEVAPDVATPSEHVVFRASVEAPE